MKTINDTLKKYNLCPLRYEKNGKSIIVDTCNGRYVLKDKVHNENIYNVTKKIIVDLTDTKNNYLYIYLKRYLTKVDDNVIFMQPKTKQATYYGIDVRVGGFNKYVDNIIQPTAIKDPSNALVKSKLLIKSPSP